MNKFSFSPLYKAFPQTFKCLLSVVFNISAKSCP